MQFERLPERLQERIDRVSLGNQPGFVQAAVPVEGRFLAVEGADNEVYLHVQSYGDAETTERTFFLATVGHVLPEDLQLVHIGMATVYYLAKAPSMMSYKTAKRYQQTVKKPKAVHVYFSTTGAEE